ncbi:hypothetical protein VTH06DRAFT_3491 [Thermothelomyces fergusii]
MPIRLDGIILFSNPTSHYVFQQQKKTLQSIKTSCRTYNIMAVTNGKTHLTEAPRRPFGGKKRERTTMSLPLQGIY